MTVASLTRSPGFTNPTRRLTSLLAPFEKRCLVWLAHRMPAWINSDHLSALALAAMLGAGLSYWLASVHPAGIYLAVVSLAVNWFGDSLDGTLARVRRCERPRFGFYVDHVIDAIGAVFLMTGLALSGLMTPVIAAVFLAAYLLLCVEIFLRSCALGEFQMSFFGVGPTELRILLAAGSLYAMAYPTAELFGRTFLLFDVGAVVGAAGLTATFLVSAARTTRTLFRAEPIRRPEAPDQSRVAPSGR